MTLLKSTKVQLHISAAISVVGLVLMIYGTVQFYTKYLQYLDPPSDQDVWEGGDVVKAIRQRALTAGTYISGLHHALAIIGIGAGLQCALVFRLTKNVLTAVRTLLQVELIYQALTSHQHKGSEVTDRESKAATVVKMGNYGIYFGWVLNGLNITAVSVLQRPLRATINGRDLISVWTSIGMALAVLTGVLLANHLAEAEWSVWYVKPVSLQKQLSRSNGSGQQVSSELSSGDGIAVIKDTNTSTTRGAKNKQHIKAAFRFLTCTVSVLARLSILSLIALSVRGLISAVIAARFVTCSLAYYALTRRAIDSMFWGYISGGLHLAFDRSTYQKAWWLSIAWAILYSTTGIVCGVLQFSMYLFTRRYNRSDSTLYGVQYATSGNASNSLAVERNFGVFTASMAAADLLMYFAVVILHLRNDADRFEANLQMLSMPGP